MSGRDSARWTVYPLLALLAAGAVVYGHTGDRTAAPPPRSRRELTHGGGRVSVAFLKVRGNALGREFGLSLRVSNGPLTPPSTPWGARAETPSPA